MRYACREVEGTPEPALHIPRWPLIRIFSVIIVKWFAFLNKRPQGARWALWKQGRNSTTRHANTDSQPAIYIYMGSQPQ